MSTIMTLKNCTKLEFKLNQTNLQDSSFAENLEMTNTFQQTNTRQPSSLGDQTMLNYYPKQSMNDTSLFDNTLHIPDPKRTINQNY